MAYSRRKSYSRKRTGNRRSRYSRTASRRTPIRRRTVRKRARNQQTVRIILEQPQPNAVQRPDFGTIEAKPKKASF